MNKATSNDLGIPVTSALPPASPEKIAREAAALSGLVASLNKAGEIRPEDIPAPAPAPVVRPPMPQTPATKPVEQVTHSRTPFNTKLLAFSGSLKSGKDHVAAAAGATIFGFAEPLYAMRRVFFGDVPKDAHGAREFLQLAGNYGRGVISPQYPLGPSRASFVTMCRSLGSRGEFGFPEVRWDLFGKSETLWLDACLKRIENYTQQHENSEARVAITNVRFKNEHERLVSAGFTVWHVMASTQTWEQRIRDAGLDPKSPALSDVSEQMAMNLNAQALQASRRAPTRKLRVVWSDDKIPAPSSAFFTLNEFLKELALFS